VKVEELEENVPDMFGDVHMNVDLEQLSNERAFVSEPEFNLPFTYLSIIS
jgi:hypothetical protein